MVTFSRIANKVSKHKNLKPLQNKNPVLILQKPTWVNINPQVINVMAIHEISNPQN